MRVRFETQRGCCIRLRRVSSTQVGRSAGFCPLHRFRSAGWRSSIWDDGCPSSLAAYPGLERNGSSRALDSISRSSPPLLGLAPGGGYLAARVTTDAGGLLHHLFTITAASPSQLTHPKEIAAAVCFSVALFRQVSPTWDYPAPHPMEPGLSSPLVWGATARPTWATPMIITHYGWLSSRFGPTVRARGLCPAGPIRFRTQRTTGGTAGCPPPSFPELPPRSG